jgi:hypothetical protein
MEEIKKLQTMHYNVTREVEIKNALRRKSLSEDDLQMIFHGAEIHEARENKSLADPLKTLLNKPGIEPAYFIHESIKARLNEIDRETTLSLSDCEPYSRERDKVFHRKVDKQAKIALNAEHLMSDLAKLDYLGADVYYDKRKIIITKMIADGADMSRSCGKALSDSVNREDIVFFEFLLKCGAQPTASVLEKIETKPAFKELFLLYKNQTK